MVPSCMAKLVGTWMHKVGVHVFESLHVANNNNNNDRG